MPCLLGSFIEHETNGDNILEMDSYGPIGLQRIYVAPTEPMKSSYEIILNSVYKPKNFRNDKHIY